MGWALIRGWALINFFCLWDERLFEVGANSRLGAYSNNYGTPQTESLLSGYTLNRTKISYNCAPMLNITVICHLIQ